MSGVSNVERCLNTGYAATDDQDGISDWNLYLFLRLKQTSPRHCHLHNIFGFFGRRLAVIQVHPAAVLSDVSHFQQIRVQPGFSDTFAEGGLMKPRRAGSYDYAVQLMFFNVFLYFHLAWVSAGISVSHRNDYTGKLFRRAPYFFRIYRPGNV
jgi:hypothetical protein